MEKTLFKNETPAERLKSLESNCDKVEEASYMKQFTHDEIIEFKEELSNVSIELYDIGIEKAEATKTFTEQAKKPTKRKAEVLGYIKDKAVSVKGQCFVFLDQEDKTAYYFNGDGDQVFSRQLLPSERQKTFFSTLRAEKGEKVAIEETEGIPGLKDGTNE